jgi:ribosome maturation factor RimP
MQAKIEIMLTPIVNDLGYDLWGCEYLSQGKSRLLRVYIDNNTGISLDDCELVSKAVGAHLDVENLITDHYTLEVSSPGIPRPILHWQQFNQFLGQEIKLKLYQAVAGTKNFVGILKNVQQDSIELARDEILYSFAADQIVKAYVNTYI